MSNPSTKPITTTWSARVRPVVVLMALLMSVTTFAGVAAPLVAGAAKAGPTISLDEHNNHHVINVAVGTRLHVTLHSTYWSLVATKLTPVLVQVGRTRVVGVAPNGAGHCVPGQGCGTLSANFVAAHPGTVHLRATRTSCGEALRCSAAQSAWTISIHVH
ncbi:MAG: hypothetical protein HKL86_07990 [Acidimicrobiaceae bacterium]|nr:hypothetical protein [Acidimicrobiaceae bacterium]